MGIPGNERVDEAAKTASSLRHNPLLFHTKTDLSLFITHLINNKWQEQWSSQQQLNHLAKIKTSTAPWTCLTDHPVVSKSFSLVHA